jgi:DNA-binding Lrp family transcriptional regulator
MVYICVLVRVVPGQVLKVVEVLKGVPGVEEVFPVFGRYDVAVIATAPDLESARNLSRTINAMENVRSTETLIES